MGETQRSYADILDAQVSWLRSTNTGFKLTGKELATINLIMDAGTLEDAETQGIC